MLIICLTAMSRKDNAPTFNDSEWLKIKDEFC